MMNLRLGICLLQFGIFAPPARRDPRGADSGSTVTQISGMRGRTTYAPGDCHGDCPPDVKLPYSFRV